MDYYLGGYYLVEGVPRPTYSATFLPSMIWSISTCVSPIYPDTWALSWTSVTDDDRLAAQTRLGLTAEEFKEMQAWVDTAFNEDRFGWSNAWLNLTDAQEYYRRYLQAIPRIKLLGIGLPAPHRDECLAAGAPNPGMGQAGLYLLLLQQQKLSNLESILGFEILNVEFGDINHSFLCNHLESDYQQMHLTFNEHGLLTHYDEAQHAAEFTNLDTTGAESPPWFPWLIVQYPLAATSM